jgi:hypothetical protein
VAGEYDGAGSLFALGLRATLLDATGAPLAGDDTCYVTDALVAATIGLEYNEAEEISQTNGSGVVCLAYRAPDTLKQGTISDLQLCTPDPNVQSFFIGGDTIERAAVAEVQNVTITGTPTGGTFTLTYSGQTTAPIAYNANAAAVTAALEALSNLAPADVVTTGGPGPGTPYVVTFAVALGNVAQMTANGALLTGGAAPAIAVTTVTPGVVASTIGYRAPQVGVTANPNGISLELWTRAVVDSAYAADLPYFHWVLPRVYLKPSEGWTASGSDPMLPGFEGFSNQNANWGDGPLPGGWAFPSDRVWQYARVATVPDLSPGFVTVA